MERCPGLFGVHRFEARHDKSSADPAVVSHAKAQGIDAVAMLLDAACSRTYVHDICVRCGQIVKRGGA